MSKKKIDFLLIVNCDSSRFTYCTQKHKHHHCSYDIIVIIDLWIVFHCVSESR